eukprot:scaffold86483_cov47-Prasinocladus_malaysianus.AAC.1
MECLASQNLGLGADKEPIVTESATALRKLSSSIQRRASICGIQNVLTYMHRKPALLLPQPLLELNDEVKDASRALARQISQLQAPTFVNRDTAIVNLGATAEQGKQVSEPTLHAKGNGTRATFKRLGSINWPRQPVSSSTPTSNQSSQESLQQSNRTAQAEGAAGHEETGPSQNEHLRENQPAPLSKWTPSRQ